MTANLRGQLVTSLFHPSDFSRTSQNAFAHALALALVGETELTIFHVSDAPSASTGWQKFPAVRETLRNWGMLDEDSPASAVLEKLRIDVHKIEVKSGQPLNSILSYLDENPNDLIVLGTRGAEGLPRWINPSISEALARRSRTMTLFVPEGCRGFVSPRDGSISMERILLPVDRKPHPGAGVEVAVRASRLEPGTTEITILHSGDEGMPRMELPEDPGWRWSTEEVDGDPVERILDAADRRNVNLIVMVTAGHNGILDALRGSTTERVLRRSPCPVLAIPVGAVSV